MSGLPPLTKLAGATACVNSVYYNRSALTLTVRARDSPRRANRADSLRIGTVGELEPIVGVGLQVLRLNFERKVDIIAGESGAGVEGTSEQLDVVEDFEGDANRDALVGKTGINRRGAGPQQHGTVPRIAL